MCFGSQNDTSGAVLPQWVFEQIHVSFSVIKGGVAIGAAASSGIFSHQCSENVDL